MKFFNKASSLESCADVAPRSFQLVAILFVAVTAAVPTEMLKREVLLIRHFTRNSSVLTPWQPGSSLESEARGTVHCNAICKPGHCELGKDLLLDVTTAKDKPHLIGGTPKFCNISVGKPKSIEGRKNCHDQTTRDGCRDSVDFGAGTQRECCSSASTPLSSTFGSSNGHIGNLTLARTPSHLGPTLPNPEAEAAKTPLRDKAVRCLLDGDANLDRSSEVIHLMDVRLRFIQPIADASPQDADVESSADVEERELEEDLQLLSVGEEEEYRPSPVSPSPSPTPESEEEAEDGCFTVDGLSLRGTVRSPRQKYTCFRISDLYSFPPNLRQLLVAFTSCSFLARDWQSRRQPTGDSELTASCEVEQVYDPCLRRGDVFLCHGASSTHGLYTDLKLYSLAAPLVSVAPLPALGRGHPRPWDKHVRGTNLVGIVEHTIQLLDGSAQRSLSPSAMSGVSAE
ncbi:hypothetical protein B0H14DRAFT_2556032 [Mycena olivaceomarginata]|nr:hypothetical protein B0H14DRAFT_2556032 [Mycena olivaceomarginata]